MKKVLIGGAVAIVALGAGWTGMRMVGEAKAQTALATIADQMRARGGDFRFDGFTLAKAPFEKAGRIDEPSYSFSSNIPDPETGEPTETTVTWSAPWLDVEISGDAGETVTLTFPDEQTVTVEALGETYEIPVAAKEMTGVLTTIDGRRGLAGSAALLSAETPSMPGSGLGGISLSYEEAEFDFSISEDFDPEDFDTWDIRQTASAKRLAMALAPDMAAIKEMSGDDEGPDDMSLSFAFEDMKTEGETNGAKSVGSFTAASATYEQIMTDDEFGMAVTGAYNGLDLTYDFDAPQGFAGLAAGQIRGVALDAAYSLTSATGKMTFTPSENTDMPPFDVDIASGPASVVMQVADDVLTVESDSESVSYSAVEAPMVGDASFEMGAMNFGLTMPLAAGEEPQTTHMRLNLADIVASKNLWALGGVPEEFPTDIKKLALDADFDAIWSLGVIDMIEDDIAFAREEAARAEDDSEEARMARQKREIERMMSRMESEPVPTKARINDLTLEAFDAAVYATADVDLTAEGETATGTANVRLIKIEDLINRLVEIGLVPEQPAMMAQMMIGSMGQPGEEEGETVFDIEMSDGMTVVNGAPVGPAIPKP